MKHLLNTTDATLTYRESSAATSLRMDGTADTGCLVEVMRDAVVVISPGMQHSDGLAAAGPPNDVDPPPGVRNG